MWVTARGKAGVGGGGQKAEMGAQRDLAWGNGRTMQCADVLLG